MASTSSLSLPILELLQEIDAIIARRDTPRQRMDRIVEFLHERIARYTWVGIYFMDGHDLVLGPFRGKPSPHTRISLNQGICGAAALQKQTVVVPDVNADPRFLACSLETRSEIVVPVMDGSTCLAEIDVDSDHPDAFGDTDSELLESIAERLVSLIKPLGETV